MKINENNYEITTTQYDYGVPIMFEAGKDEGFNIGDTIIFTFSSPAISTKYYQVNSDDFSFGLALTKEEADSVFPNKHIYYSAKRYSEGNFLETLVDSRMTFTPTVKWKGEENG